MAKKAARFDETFVMQQAAKRKNWKKKGVKAGHGGDFDTSFETPTSFKEPRSFESTFEEVNMDVCAMMINTDGLPPWLVAIINKDPEIQRGILKKGYMPASPHKVRLVNAARDPKKNLASRFAEHIIQVRLFYEVERRFPEEYKMMYSIPNSANSTGNGLKGFFLNAEGLKSGVLDFNIDIPKGKYHGFRMDVKTTRGKASPEQVEQHDRNQKRGYYSIIEKGFEACWKHVEAYLSLPNFDNKTAITIKAE